MPRQPSADLTSLHAVVPARGSGDGKSRLGEALDAEERLTLVVGMLLQTLEVLAAWPACAAVHVVSSDPRTRRLVRESGTGAAAVAEAQPAGLNAALLAGRDRAVRAGATAVLYLPADLPHLSSAALDSMLEAADAALAAGGGDALVVIAPADARMGTNALLVAPVATIEPHFGEQSLEAHIRAAALVGASLQLVPDAELGFDLDTPDDLERLDAARVVELQARGQRALDAVADPITAEVA